MRDFTGCRLRIEVRKKKVFEQREKKFLGSQREETSY